MLFYNHTSNFFGEIYQGIFQGSVLGFVLSFRKDFHDFLPSLAALLMLKI